MNDLAWAFITTSALGLCHMHVGRILDVKRLHMQDMPLGMHGMFPVLLGDSILIAAGGTSAGYSQSTIALSFATS